MTKNHLHFSDVYFSYDSMTAKLINGFSHTFAPGWYGVTGPNGAGKTTFLMLACGLLGPEAGRIVRHGTAYYCGQRTDLPPDEIAVEGAHCLPGVPVDFRSRWQELSHGERKRAQLACALASGPGVLAVDEPTNHLDASGREAVAAALASFKGIGLIVSHDRELLDRLCGFCLTFSGGTLTVRPGGATAAEKIMAEEREALHRRYRAGKKEYDRLAAEAARLAHEAARSDDRMSKRHIKPGDKDARDRINLARLTGRDAVSGRQKSRMDSRLKRAAEGVASIGYTREKASGIWLEAQASRRNSLIECPPCELALGPGVLKVPQLRIGSRDRMAVSGPNGAGKSTLIRHLVPMINAPAERVCYIPQEIPEQEGRRMWNEVRRMSGGTLGRIMTLVSRLGSDPAQLLQSVSPSPGETRKLMLALGIMNGPHILVMDEPTNHMDLLSVRCLEEALSECPCAMVLVSHDRRFLERLNVTEWWIGNGRLNC